jgi:hypothetical protein
MEAIAILVDVFVALRGICQKVYVKQKVASLFLRIYKSNALKTIFDTSISLQIAAYSKKIVRYKVNVIHDYSIHIYILEHYEKVYQAVSKVDLFLTCTCWFYFF